MFERSTLFAIMNDGSLKKFQMTNTFNNTRSFFNDLYNRYENYSKSAYTYGYKNDFNELSYVENFFLEQRIIDAVTDASIINDVISAYTGLSGRLFRKYPDTKPETSGHLVDKFDFTIMSAQIQYIG